MAKQPIKYKVIRQSAEMGGKFYGVINNADTINAELTMEQIIDKRKLHNFSAKQLTVLMEEVLQGAAELVARDGMPRNLSSLLKFEARIRGTFANTESGITTQDILVKPRMLKDIKVTIDKDNFTFVNESGDTSPKITGLAEESGLFVEWSREGAFIDESEVSTASLFKPFGPLTVSGVRLAPSGQWSEDYKMSVALVRGESIYRLDHYAAGDEEWGMWTNAASVASDNVLKFAKDTTADGNCWRAITLDPTVAASEAYLDVDEHRVVPTTGDRLVFTFARLLGDGSGSVVMASKEVTLL